MAIHSLYTLSKDDPEARTWLSFFRHHGYPGLNNLVIERVFWLEGTVQMERLLPLLVNPLHQVAAPDSQLDPGQGPIVEIAYRPAVTDPETPSILAGARALGESGLEFARLSRRYQFCGLNPEEAQTVSARFLYNHVVERVREPGETVSTLRPTGTPDPVATISLLDLSDAELEALSRQRSCTRRSPRCRCCRPTSMSRPARIRTRRSRSWLNRGATIAITPPGRAWDC